MTTLHTSFNKSFTLLDFNRHVCFMCLPSLFGNLFALHPVSMQPHQKFIAALLHLRNPGLHVFLGNWNKILRARSMLSMVKTFVFYSLYFPCLSMYSLKPINVKSMDSTANCPKTRVCITFICVCKCFWPSRPLKMYRTVGIPNPASILKGFSCQKLAILCCGPRESPGTTLTPELMTLSRNLFRISFSLSSSCFSSGTTKLPSVLIPGWERICCVDIRCNLVLCSFNPSSWVHIAIFLEWSARDAISCMLCTSFCSAEKANAKRGGCDERIGMRVMD